MVQSSTSELRQHTNYSSLHYSRRKNPTELKNVSIGSNIRNKGKKEKEVKRQYQRTQDKASKHISIDYQRSRSKRRSAVPSFVAESAAIVAAAAPRTKHRTVAAAAAAAAACNHYDDDDSWADMNDESSSFYMNALMEAIDTSSDEEKGNDVAVDYGRTRRRSAMPSLSLRDLMAE